MIENEANVKWEKVGENGRKWEKGQREAKCVSSFVVIFFFYSSPHDNNDAMGRLFVILYLLKQGKNRWFG